MDLNTMLLFIKVIEAGSFMGASRSTGIPKSTISRRISDLEQDLGVRLLQRNTRTLDLTEVGNTFLAHCHQIAQDAEEARTSVTQHQKEPRGKLRVTASVLFGERFLGPLLCEYLGKYTNVEIDLFLSSRHVNLISEGFDLAIRAGSLQTESLIARKLAPTPHYLCVSPKYLQAHKAPQSPEDLKELSCIVYSPEREDAVWKLSNDQKTLEIPVKGPLSVNSLPLALEAVLHGYGIGNIPGFLCCDLIRSGQLVHLLPVWSLPIQWLHALYPSRLHLSAIMRTFLDLISKKLTPAPWIIESDSFSPRHSFE